MTFSDLQRPFFENIRVLHALTPAQRLAVVLYTLHRIGLALRRISHRVVVEMKGVWQDAEEVAKSQQTRTTSRASARHQLRALGNLL